MSDSAHEQHLVKQPVGLKKQGFRFVERCGKFFWSHPAEILLGDTDCTDMGDAEFEQFVLSFNVKLRDAEPASSAERPLDLIVGRRFVCVSLGAMYADECSVCGVHGYWGLATTHGPQGCVEAVKAKRVYCDAHLPKPYGRYEPPNAQVTGAAPTNGERSNDL